MREVLKRQMSCSNRVYLGFVSSPRRPDDRTEDIDLHEFVSDYVEPDQEHAVGQKLRSDGLGHVQHGIVDLDCLRFAADPHVGSTVGGGVDSPEGRDRTFGSAPCQTVGRSGASGALSATYKR
jgi:hypothetical protein